MDVRRVLSYVRRACEDYDMIKAGDRIAVGISGGKDSLTLLCALAEMRRFYPNPFEVVGITIDMGFPDGDFTPVKKLCEELNVPYHIVKTDIYDIIFNVRKEKSPCALTQKCGAGRCTTPHGSSTAAWLPSGTITTTWWIPLCSTSFTRGAWGASSPSRTSRALVCV